MIPSSYIQFNIFNPYSNLVCAFSTRFGGTSKDPYHSLNLGLKTGDKLAFVHENRARFIRSLSINEDQIAYTDQVHSANVEIVTKAGIYAETDALITVRKNLFLVIQTADCFPLFVVDPGTNIIAAIHAGWRGALQGVIENTLKTMETKLNVNPDNLFVAVGPGLQQECFEIQSDVYDQIENKYLKIHSDETKRFLDLKNLIIDKLLQSGLNRKHIYDSGRCTKCEKESFYSFRRDKNKSGRMMGIIGQRG